MASPNASADGGAGACEQDVVGLGDVGVRHAAVDRADRRAGLVVVEADALGALLGDDVEDVVGDGGMHGAVGGLPLHAPLIDGGVGALGLAGPAVDTLAGDHRRHRLPTSFGPAGETSRRNLL